MKKEDRGIGKLSRSTAIILIHRVNVTGWAVKMLHRDCRDYGYFNSKGLDSTIVTMIDSESQGIGF